MDPGNAIELKDVVKTYTLPVATGEKGIAGRTKTEKQTNTVLDRISLSVKKGEVLGIVGRNGCGKSTLLKIISGITDPDSGEVHVSGKVASILELGMGFHQDMSGRENILLKGELYGFSKKEMESRMDSIIRYSGIGRYIDSPVRTYSSGMIGRLAFSVMINVEADIMLVDEILSTGDAGFAGKAKDHFRKLSKSGRTVLFVSHSLPAIDDMCTRAIWIEDGKVRMDGPAKKITAAYSREIEESYDYVLDEAESGSADAQYRLALMFRDGSGAERSTELFGHWIREAALQGHAAAQCEYADLLVSEGGDENLAEASRLYQSSAEKGWEDAMAKVAVSGAGSEDPQREEVKAIFRELAERGNPFDEFRYADLLLRTAMTRDGRAEALRWFEKAAEHGNLNAMHQAAMMHLNGTGTKKDTAKYVEYMEKAAAGGRMGSVMNIADAYHAGKWVARDDAKALAWYLKAAAAGVPKAQYNAAVMYRDGEGTEADPEKAEEWFRIYSRSAIVNHQIWASEAARNTKLNVPVDSIKLLEEAVGNRNNTAAFQLGNMYCYGLLGSVSPEKAAELYSLTESELSYFTVTAADSLFRGLGGKSDYVKAFGLYRKAAVTNGDPVAYLRLARLYRDGLGTEKNYDKYIQCLTFSAERGNKDAMSQLISIKKMSETESDSKTHN
ncbi:MAG: ATP-binding cassette domain-containing protein [Candidatus Methanomethylophilus sp.]|jgi:ABC-2 type transport system ATP-binding protein|nr:ATP-binding cassette domain-containing protein [Methanomethylophilus sp.]MCI2074464.1 ATP-binding cassette domain-containing protein [Methanomethylophilus sp.]MCI2093863.1 ATP-binding cassette domain-containing protein [Methanomethylophilus sp.]